MPVLQTLAFLAQLEIGGPELVVRLLKLLSIEVLRDASVPHSSAQSHEAHSLRLHFWIAVVQLLWYI